MDGGGKDVRLSRRGFLVRGAAVALSLPLLGACTRSAGQPAPTAAQSKPSGQAPGANQEIVIRFAAGANPGYGPFHIVEDTEIYKRVGATATVQVFDTGSKALAAVLDGQADVASTGDVPLINALAKGGDATRRGEVPRTAIGEDSCAADLATEIGRGRRDSPERDSLERYRLP